MGNTENISPEQLKKWLESNEALLIDVREPDEYKFEHIKGAVNVPLASASAETLPDAGGKKIVVQCGTGVRSSQACGKITANDTLYNLEGGLNQWKQSGFDIVKDKKAVLPLQRQVQAVVGAMIILLVALGYLVNPVFYLLTAFIGAGLLNAGLTGWCGMAKLLAVMPWNKGS